MVALLLYFILYKFHSVSFASNHVVTTVVEKQNLNLTNTLIQRNRGRNRERERGREKERKKRGIMKKVIDRETQISRVKHKHIYAFDCTTYIESISVCFHTISRIVVVVACAFPLYPPERDTDDIEMFFNNFPRLWGGRYASQRCVCITHHRKPMCYRLKRSLLFAPCRNVVPECHNSIV